MRSTITEVIGVVYAPFLLVEKMISFDPVVDVPVGGQAGIEKIVIPRAANEMTPQVVEKYIAQVLSTHERNAQKIQKYFDILDGTHHKIDDKKRDFMGEQHNNKVKLNFANALVTFKRSFLCGDKREFSPKTGVTTDDLTYLDRYLSDCSFFTKDAQVKDNVYSCGVGIDYIAPRTDILKAAGNGSAFKSKSEGYDVKTESPFVYECLDPRYNGVVYSSKIGQPGMGDLFAFNISKDVDGKLVITVYTREWIGQFGEDEKLIEGSLQATPVGYKEIPMVEHTLNRSRTGAIELVEKPLDAINAIVSNCVDNIVDNVNYVLAFFNCDVSSKQLQEMYKGGCILVDSSAAEKEGRLEKLSLLLDFEKINQLFEQVLTRTYDIVGVPLASANVTSGGDTGQARLLGGGWTNAYTVIKSDIIAFEQADKEVLKRMFLICRLNKQNPVNKVSASQVEIKYNVNMRDNILVKTQALQNMYDVHMPLEDILNATGIFGDTRTVAAKWATEIEKAEQKEKEQQNRLETTAERTAQQTQTETTDQTEKLPEEGTQRSGKSQESKL